MKASWVLLVGPGEVKTFGAYFGKGGLTGDDPGRDAFVRFAIG